jgi:glycosyltransferase involved in cell wall biosynthesis
VLSEDMRRSVLRRDPHLADKIVVLNNFELPSYDAGPEVPASPLPTRPDRVRIAFTGNLGRFQNLDVITRAVLGDDPALERIELVLMGEGAAKAQLARLAAEAPAGRQGRVVLLPHGTPAQARALLRTSDHGLVSLAPEVIRYAYPSKTATYLSEGLPLVVAVEPDSALAGMVESSGAGRFLPVDATLEEALAELADAGPTDPARREAAREVWDREFSAAVLLSRWSDLFDKAAGGGAGERA